MISTMSYTSVVSTELIGEKEYTIRNLTPKFEDEDECKNVKQKIADTLYNIFCKYSD